MIEVKKNKDRFDFCNSCGSAENLVEVGIRRSRSMNTTVICLCRDCVDEIYKQTIRIGGKEA